MVWRLQIDRIALTLDEWRAITRPLADIFGAAHRIPLSDFSRSAAVLAQEFPRRLRTHFYEFRTRQGSHALCVRGDAPSDLDIGATPDKHAPPGQIETISRYDAIHFMFATLLGEPFGWTTIQSGYVFNDVIPIKSHAALPASSGYSNDFGLHTEDAFHEAAGDYLGLMCLRNPDSTTTPLAGFEPADVPIALYATLFEPRYIVGANVAHDVDTVTGRSAILFGNPAFPYFRINLNATAAQPGDTVASEALDHLRAALMRNATAVAFAPGEFWYLDNLRLAHGRDAYTPRFDSRDRWLRRLYVGSGFRYTTALRDSADGRTLDPSRPLNHVRVA